MFCSRLIVSRFVVLETHTASAWGVTFSPKLNGLIFEDRHGILPRLRLPHPTSVENRGFKISPKNESII